MIQWQIYNFYKLSLWIDRQRILAAHAVKDAGRNSQVHGVENGLLVGERRLFYTSFEAFREECEKLNLYTTCQRIFELTAQIGNPIQSCYWSEIESGLKGIQWAMERDLTLPNFAYFHPKKAEYFEREKLFGEKVFNDFPAMREDIKNAGNCLASDLNDAAVFYLLRIVEMSLRDLARNLKAKFPKTPLDYEGWKGVVDAIDNRLSEKTPKARGPKQAKALKFKHDLLADFKAFEVLRNDILHGRSHHTASEALSLFNRVRDFIQRLDAQIFPSLRSVRKIDPNKTISRLLAKALKPT
jgi:hypothetical protein